MLPYDAIVVGLGGVGSATLYQLARRGARVLGLDQFFPPHDLGASHGETRVIRQAYFEHPDYVPLLQRSYALWSELEARSGQSLYTETGLLQAGPADGVVVPGVLESARRHGLAVEVLSPGEVARRFPQFRIPQGHQAVFEHRAGYLRVEACVRTHLKAAVHAGARARLGELVLGWRPDGDGVEVTTAFGHYRAHRLILTTGPWAPRFCETLGIRLTVRRKALFWYAADLARFGHSTPVYLFERPEGVFYGFPAIPGQGLKVAEHSGGDRVEDPLSVDRSLHDRDREAVEGFLSQVLPEASHDLLRHEVCLYSMSPDEHFLVDQHPEHPQVVFACGLSGHGFKFASVLGEILADLARSGRTDLPADFLRLGRFA